MKRGNVFKCSPCIPHSAVSQGYDRGWGLVSVYSGCCNKIDLWFINNRQLFLIVLEVGKSKIKVPANLVSDEDPSLVHRWLLVFSLHPHVVEGDRSSWGGRLSLFF